MVFKKKIKCIGFKSVLNKNDTCGPNTDKSNDNNQRVLITPAGSDVKISLRDEDNNTNDEDILNNKNGKNGKFNTIVINVKINTNIVSSAILKELLPCQ